MHVARTLLGIVACLILAASLATAAPLWTEDFTAGLGAWTVTGPAAGAQVAADAGQTGPGLRLTGPGGVVSPELPAAPADWLTVTCQVRHQSGAGALTVALVAAGAQAGKPALPAWRSDLPADNRWHRLELTLAPPPGGPWRLVLAVEPAGAWTVDGLSLAPAAGAAPPADPWLAGLEKAQALDPLPATWAPQGTLDATPRGIGNTTELLVNVAGIALSLPTDLNVARGARQPLLIYADNRGEIDKVLTIAVQVNSPSAYMPTYTVPIRNGSTTAVLAPVQVLCSGEYWAKYTFTAEKKSASAAVRLHVSDAYPALGQVTRLGRPLGRPNYVPFSGFLLDPPNPPGDGLRLSVPASNLGMLPPAMIRGNPALAQLPVGSGDPATTAAQTVAAYQALTEQTLPNLTGTALVSPSWPVTPGEKGLEPSPVMRAAFDGGLAKWVQSVAVGLGELPGGGVLEERVDGRARPLVNSGWELFGRRYGFTALRAWLAQAGPARPLLLDLSAVQTSAAPRLELLLLARLLLEQTWQGSTGVLLDADARLLAGPDGQPISPVYEGIQELWRELAGAVPINIPTGSDGLCGTGPDAPVRCWAFLRGSEGILFLANNTSAPVDVTAEIRAEPTSLQVLRLRATGPAVTREIQGAFRFSPEAEIRRQEAIYARLAPGEIVGLAVQMTNPDWSWLRSVGRMAPREQPQSQSGPPPAGGDQPWYERGRGLLGG
jgi:hypothetical protein